MELLKIKITVQKEDIFNAPFTKISCPPLQERKILFISPKGTSANMNIA